MLYILACTVPFSSTSERFSRVFPNFWKRFPCTAAIQAAFRCTDRQDPSPTGCFPIRTQYTPNTLLLLLLHYAIQEIHRRPEQRAAPKHTHSVLDARAGWMRRIFWAPIFRFRRASANRGKWLRIGCGTMKKKWQPKQICY